MKKKKVKKTKKIKKTKKKSKYSLYGIELDYNYYTKEYVPEHGPFLENYHDKIGISTDLKITTEMKGKDFDTRKLNPTKYPDFIKKFFPKNKKTVGYEGIWELPGYCFYGLVKKGNRYDSYIIDFHKEVKVAHFSVGKLIKNFFVDQGSLDYSILNGTRDGSFYITKTPNVLKHSGIMTAISFKNENERLPINFLTSFNCKIIDENTIQNCLPGLEKYEYVMPIAIKKIWCSEHDEEDKRLAKKNKTNNERINVSCGNSNCESKDYIIGIQKKDLNSARCVNCDGILKKRNSQPNEKEPGQIKNKDKTSGVGTGFFVSNTGHIITNYHVVGSSDNINVQYNGDDIKAKVLATDQRLDLALLKIKIKNKNFVKFSSKSPYKSQEILVAGYPFGKAISDDLKITGGIINSLKGAGNDTTRMQIDATINPGNSGGPIVDKLTKNLVGVAVSQLSKTFTKENFGVESENTNYGIKASQVRDFLESNNMEVTINNNKNKIQNIEKSTVFIIRNT